MVSISLLPWASWDYRTYLGDALTSHPPGGRVTHRPHLQGRRNPHSGVEPPAALKLGEKDPRDSSLGALRAGTCRLEAPPTPGPVEPPCESPGNCG